MSEKTSCRARERPEIARNASGSENDIRIRVAKPQASSGAATGLPKAYFDSSLGAIEPEGADLALDPRICDAKAAAAIASWLGTAN